MTLAVLAALVAVPAGAATAQWLIIGALGFTIYGPQMLIGLCGAELVSPTAVSASQVCAMPPARRPSRATPRSGRDVAWVWHACASAGQGEWAMNERGGGAVLRGR